MADVTLRIATTTVLLKPTSRPVTLQIRSGRGGIGEQGPAGQVEDYVHTQPSASSLWTITHNLDRRPTITVYSVGGVAVDARITHLTDDVSQAQFNSPFAGTARCV